MKVVLSHQNFRLKETCSNLWFHFFQGRKKVTLAFSLLKSPPSIDTHQFHLLIIDQIRFTLSNFKVIGEVPSYKTLRNIWQVTRIIIMIKALATKCKADSSSWRKNIQKYNLWVIYRLVVKFKKYNLWVIYRLVIKFKLRETVCTPSLDEVSHDPRPMK